MAYILFNDMLPFYASYRLCGVTCLMIYLNCSSKMEPVYMTKQPSMTDANFESNSTEEVLPSSKGGALQIKPKQQKARSVKEHL